MSYVRYIDKTRDYYRSQGYEKAYNWAHFDEALRRLGRPMSRVLHVAQSLFHDVAPAKALGVSCVWVNRRAGRPGGGATFPADARPDVEVRDLLSLVERMGLGAQA